MVTETGPETVSEKTVFDKGETAGDPAYPVMDKWISHNRPPFAPTVSHSDARVYQSFFYKIVYPGETGMILTANALSCGKPLRQGR